MSVLRRIYLNESWMLNLTSFSMLSILFENVVWAYSGSPFPQMQDVGALDQIWLWALWLVMIAVPLVTTVLWLLRLRHSRQAPRV